MASGTFHVHSGSEVFTRESDGKTCGIVWVVGDDGHVFNFAVIVEGEES